MSGNMRKRLKVRENIREKYVKARRGGFDFWACNARPRLCRKTNARDGSAWETKKRKTNAEMDGLTVSTETRELLGHCTTVPLCASKCYITVFKGNNSAIQWC